MLFAMDVEGNTHAGGPLTVKLFVEDGGQTITHTGTSSPPLELNPKITAKEYASAAVFTK